MTMSTLFKRFNTFAIAAATSAVLFGGGIASGSAFAADIGISEGLTQDVSTLPAGTYELDSSHTGVTWLVGHLGLSRYQGRFDDVSGTLDFDPANLENAKLSITIKADSVNIQSQVLEDKLRTDQGFNVAQHPDITFESTSVTRTGDTTGRVQGNLTMLGITKPVTLVVRFNGGAVNAFSGKQTLGFSARGTLNRSEFELTSWAPAIGDRVDLIIDAEFALAD